jgi:hypothetical protein
MKQTELMAMIIVKDQEIASLHEALKQIELSLELSEVRVKADEQEILLLRTEKSDGKSSESIREQTTDCGGCCGICGGCTSKDVQEG